MQIRSFAAIKNPLQLQQNPTQVPASTQLIFAVMASPEVLKKSGRNQMDNPEQLSLVELMCEFVEAMNPGVVLSKYVNETDECCNSIPTNCCSLFFTHRKPEVLRDRDIAGELKDVWSAVQNFRDRERAAVNDIVVYTEFGPGPDATAAAAESISPKTNEPDNKFNDSVKITDSNVDECDAGQITTTTTSNDIVECNSSDNVEQENSDKSTLQQLSPTKTNSSATLPPVEQVEPPASPPISDVQKIEIEKLTISPSESKKSSSTKTNNANHHNNESSEKIVKIQNQKNKESFLPKLFTSNKDKDKDKDKEKVKDEPEVKTKTKKSLIFFRRSKSTTSSPTHAPTNNATADKNEDDN